MNNFCYDMNNICYDMNNICYGKHKLNTKSHYYTITLRKINENSFGGVLLVHLVGIPSIEFSYCDSDISLFCHSYIYCSSICTYTCTYICTYTVLPL